MFSSADEMTGASTPPWVWTTIEASVGVIAACLPTMAPLIRSAPSASQLSRSLRRRMSLYNTRKSSNQLGPLTPERSGYSDYSFGSKKARDSYPLAKLDRPDDRKWQGPLATIGSTTRGAEGNGRIIRGSDIDSERGLGLDFEDGQSGRHWNTRTVPQTFLREDD